MRVAQVVLDTNVILSALRSSRGASHRLLGLVGQSRKFEINLSVPLVLEYEEVLKRHTRQLGLSSRDIDAVVDYLCAVGNQRRIYFLWRPVLSDPEDDHILELAVESSAQFIVTFNKRDFQGAETFGVEIVTPREFLQRIKELI